VTTPLGRYRKNYQPPFLAFLAHPNEATLHAAYELGRAALADDLSLLDLVRTHHTVLAEVLLAGVDPPGLPAILDAAAGFLVESLAPFEMVRRSFLEHTSHEKTSDGPAR
jgi:hypothetical protein